jgi:hypothetical protein
MELDMKPNSSTIADMNCLRFQNLLYFPQCLTNEVCNIIHTRHGECSSLFSNLFNRELRLFYQS